MTTEINREAPAVARREIEIAASPVTVWALHADIEAWPDWHPDITAADPSGPLGTGSTFAWRSGPATITSSLAIFDPPNRMLWTGRAMGTRAIHDWRFELANGGTRVVTEESMEGWPVSLLRGFFQKTLDRSLDAWLGALKAEAEERSG